MKKNINGLSVYCVGDSTKPSLVFLHGFPFDATLWNAQIEALSDDYYCVAYDIRGLGNSSVENTPFTMESFIDDLEEVMEVLALQKPIVCGFSMGGYIALRAVERFESKFSALILCDTISHADSNEGKLKRAAAIKAINTKGLAPFVEGFVDICFGKEFKEHSQDVLVQLKAQMKQCNPLGVKASLVAMAARTDTTENLSKITLPTLVCCGEDDAITPLEVVKKMAQSIHGAHFVSIPKSGHVAPMENPEALNRAIKAFLVSF